MPRPKEYDNTYPDKLREIGIELLEDFCGSKKHHLMKCLFCDHTWTATPISKLQNYKKHGKCGCPECTTKDRENRIQKKRHENLELLHQRGLEILSDYDGRYADYGKVVGENLPIMVTVRNKNCGHTFTASSKNLLTRNVKCPECAVTYRTNILNEHVKRKHDRWAQTATEWQKYKSAVVSLSRKNYLQHKEEINPNNLPRGKAGTEGAYHLDHIVPIRWCFEHSVPEHICAHPTNLQMIPWRMNVGKRDSLKEDLPVPLVLQEYLNK